MSAPPSAAGDGSPWYRHFWPWFIVVLLGSSVAAGIATVVIAFRNADALVQDDYYREGIAINRRLSGEHAAQRLGIAGALQIDGQLYGVALDGAAPDAALTLELSHATLAERDVVVSLEPVGGGRYAGRARALPAGRYYATLRPSDAGDGDPAWRLSRAIALPASEPIPLGSSR